MRHAATVLQQDPDNAAAIALISGPAGAPPPVAVPPGTAADDAASDTAEQSAEPDAADDVLRRLDAELTDVVAPAFVDGAGGDVGGLSVERAGLRLADVGGMADVKARLEASVLAPIRNPELGRLYGKSLRGGLLLYGPPGCGKTFIARAIAGEMGAQFIPVSLADVLDVYLGQSERNLRELFDTARRNGPCVIFLDEVDAIGQKRSQNRNSAMRGTVNQLLAEMDGIAGNNDRVFVLGATNHPWDVDSALRRPGRFDRMLLVLPPDEPAREAILRYHLRFRPVERIDVTAIARRTDGYSLYSSGRWALRRDRG